MWSLGINGTIFFGGEWLAVASFGNPYLLEMGLLAFFPLAAALLALPLSLIGLLVSKTRPSAIRIFLFSLPYIAIFLLSATLGAKARSHGFKSLARRSRPLVEAITRYEKKHGVPPPSMEALAPDFISKIPTTGMPAYPKYHYSASTQTISELNFPPTPWVLYVHTPSGGINFDRFFYLPRQNYPERLGRDPVEKIEDWAYLHE